MYAKKVFSYALLKCFYAMIFRFNNLNIPLQIIFQPGHSLF